MKFFLLSRCFFWKDFFFSSFFFKAFWHRWFLTSINTSLWSKCGVFRRSFTIWQALIKANLIIDMKTSAPARISMFRSSRHFPYLRYTCMRLQGFLRGPFFLFLASFGGSWQSRFGPCFRSGLSALSLCPEMRLSSNDYPHFEYKWRKIVGFLSSFSEKVPRVHQRVSSLDWHEVWRRIEHQACSRNMRDPMSNTKQLVILPWESLNHLRNKILNLECIRWSKTDWHDD